MFPVPQRIHRLPEAFVTIGGKLALPRNFFQRFVLPLDIFTADIVNALARQDEKSAIDITAVTFRLLQKLLNFIALDIERAKTARRLDGGDGGKPPFGAMKRN